MPSRISGACNGCRTKKQKCSGDRDGCTQCSAAGIVCTWPEQRKRGPAKGYIEGLEHRLHDAETLLLQLIPLVNSDQLSTATAHLAAANDDSRDSPDRVGARSTPPVLNKKTGIEYWENFPLDTVENVRRWQQDCALHSQFRDSDVTTGIHRPGSSRGGSRPSSVDLSRENMAQAAPASVGTSVMAHRKSSNLSTSHTHYRSMSTDSYPPARGQQEFIPSTATTSSQNWNPVPAHTNNFMQGYPSEQGWQPGMPMQQQQHPHQQNQHQQQMIAAGGPMDVDGSFFTNDVKRHLFW